MTGLSEFTRTYQRNFCPGLSEEPDGLFTRTAAGLFASWRWYLEHLVEIDDENPERIDQDLPEVLRPPSHSECVDICLDSEVLICTFAKADPEILLTANNFWESINHGKNPIDEASQTIGNQGSDALEALIAAHEATRDKAIKQNVGTASKGSTLASLDPFARAILACRTLNQMVRSDYDFFVPRSVQNEHIFDDRQF